MRSRPLGCMAQLQMQRRFDFRLVVGAHEALH